MIKLMIKYKVFGFLNLTTALLCITFVATWLFEFSHLNILRIVAVSGGGMQFIAYLIFQLLFLDLLAVYWMLFAKSAVQKKRSSWSIIIFVVTFLFLLAVLAFNIWFCIAGVFLIKMSAAMIGFDTSRFTSVSCMKTVFW